MAFVDDVVLITEHLSYMTPAIKKGQKFLNFKEFSVNHGKCGSLGFPSLDSEKPQKYLDAKISLPREKWKINNIPATRSTPSIKNDEEDGDVLTTKGNILKRWKKKATSTKQQTLHFDRV